MKTMTEVGLQKQARRFADSLSHATYELGVASRTINLFRITVDGTIVKVFVFFDDSVAGEVGNIRLIDKDGDVVAIAERLFVKPEVKGLYVAFKYRFTEVEAEGVGI